MGHDYPDTSQQASSSSGTHKEPDVPVSLAQLSLVCAFLNCKHAHSPEYVRFMLHTFWHCGQSCGLIFSVRQSVSANLSAENVLPCMSSVYDNADNHVVLQLLWIWGIAMCITAPVDIHLINGFKHI